jgi:hypothetical protein
MVSTRSGATKAEHAHSTPSPGFVIKTPRRNSVTPHQAPSPVVEPPPSSTKKSLTWGESPQWNADVSIAEGHYGALILSALTHYAKRALLKLMNAQERWSRSARLLTRTDRPQASLCSSKSRSRKTSEN